MVLSLGAGVALAAPKQLNMPKGHTTTVSMPAPVASVEVADPSTVEVRMEGRKVVLVGRSTGTTEVTVKMVDGEMRLKVYVAADKYGLPY